MVGELDHRGGPRPTDSVRWPAWAVHTAAARSEQSLDEQSLRGGGVEVAEDDAGGHRRGAAQHLSGIGANAWPRCTQIEPRSLGTDDESAPDCLMPTTSRRLVPSS